MARARWLVASLLLLLAAAAGAHAAEEDQLVFVESFLNSKVRGAIAALPVSIAARANGQLAKPPPSAPRRLNVSCLHSVAPAPLGWRMWCPNTHAEVLEWVDEAGSMHRRHTLQPMPTMTAQKAVWFMTPTFPPVLEVGGQSFTKHQLWHPLDHKPKQEQKLGVYQGRPVLLTKLDEAYRSPPGKKQGFRTEIWVAASDVAANLPKNRYVLGHSFMGFQAFTLVVEFNDTPEGMVVAVELILGAAAKGFDPKNPTKGARKGLAAAANTLLVEPIMEPYKHNGDFNAALNAVTRHVVEEFGNLPNFVPQAWDASTQGQIMERLERWKARVISATSALASKREGEGGAGAQPLLPAGELPEGLEVEALDAEAEAEGGLSAELVRAIAGRLRLPGAHV